ncbi:MAG TPA: response regulator transcription factor [Terriglobia bacterium]|nr:response regulator transcription factor [Terriglobia bacterium]
MKSRKILVIDDDSGIRRVLQMMLNRESYECAEASSGEEALRKLHEFRPDLVLLDLNMPGMGGLAACRAIRAMSNAPIIVLTVRGEESDKIDALDAGADDFVTKPFAKNELLARIRASFRRSTAAPASHSEKLIIGDLAIDFETRNVRQAGKTVHLTPKEFELLQYLARRCGKPVGHRELLQGVWGAHYAEQRSLLRVFITSLRSKIEPLPGTPSYILTDPWLGYRLVGPEDMKL